MAFRDIEKQKEYYKKFKETHKEELKSYLHQYYLSNKEELLSKQKEWTKEYRKTPMGRAVLLVSNYKRHDRMENRGEGNLTAKWIVDNIFSKPCTHCGETDWTKIGCNRLDNSKPHTMDNVEPCCFKCNCVLSAQRKHKRGDNGKFSK